MADTWEDISLVTVNLRSKPYAKAIVNDEHIIYINSTKVGLITSKKSLDALLEDYDERFQNLVLEESVKILGKDYRVRKIRVFIEERITKEQYDILFPPKEKIPGSRAYVK